MKDINLLLEEEKAGVQEADKAPAGKAVKIVFLALLVAVSVGVTLVLPGAYLKILDMRLNAIQKVLQSEKYAEIKAINSEASSLDKAIQERKSILEHIDSQGYPVNEITTLIKNNVPKGCVINGMEYDTETLKLTVKVENTAQLAEFLLNMGRLDYLTLSDSSNNLRLNNTGVYAFVFNVAQRGEN